MLTINADGLLEGDECEDEEITGLIAQHLDAMCDGDCLVTLEYSPIEPGVFAQKYYAPGVGQLKAVAVEGETGYEDLTEIVVE